MSDTANPQAFPSHISWEDERKGYTEWEIHEGMTLRDYFAAKALAIGWELEKEAPTGPYSEHMEPTYLGAAQRAYFFADAMLKARQE